MLTYHIDREYKMRETELPSGVMNNTIWLDIETEKVSAPENWGFKNRWSTFMIGVAGFMDPGIMFLTVVSGTEEELVEWLTVNFEGREIRHTATREFDEMVLRGRFTNARRAHKDAPGEWPNVNAADFVWHNIRKEMLPSNYLRRSPDVPSRDVPFAWNAGEKDVVVLHNERDVIENVILDPSVKLDPFLRAELCERMFS